MSQRKEKTPQIKPVTTAITKVVAKAVDGMTAGAAPELSDVPNEANPAYTAAIERVQVALANYGRSVWQLAWALVDFRKIHEELHPHDRLTDKQLAGVLGIKLTATRIGQLVNTANAFPRDQVDESIDFRVYENARMFKPKMTPQKRLELVKKHSTTEAMAKFKPAVRDEPSAGQELVVRIKSATGENDKPEVTVRLDGTAIELPDDIVNALRKHAAKLFATSD